MLRKSQCSTDDLESEQNVIVRDDVNGWRDGESPGQIGNSVFVSGTWCDLWRCLSPLSAVI